MTLRIDQPDAGRPPGPPDAGPPAETARRRINVTIAWTNGTSTSFGLEGEENESMSTLADNARKIAYREAALVRRDHAVIVLGDPTGQHEVIADPAMWIVEHVSGSRKRGGDAWRRSGR